MGTVAPPQNGDLERLLEYLRDRRNFDFRGYKRASLSRRVYKRMQAVGAEDYEEYMAILEANPGEFAELFNTILINVTALMRDRDAWEVVARQVVPDIAASKGPDEPIRVWSAGTASGEEAYTLAVILADGLGEARFRRSVKLYATDADEDALAEARHGRYRERDLLTAFGEDRVAQYFDVEGGYGTLRGDLRRAMIFGRHDLAQDPPISRIDLMVCRNTLMYFTSDMQQRVLASFNFALGPGGYLFLGKSEALVTRSNLFEVVDLHQHVFRKDGRAEDARPPMAFAPRSGRDQAGTLGADQAFEQSGLVQIVVDAGGTLVHANRAARPVFGLLAADFGRHIRTMTDSAFPSELAATVSRALRDRRHAVLTSVPLPGGGSAIAYDVVVSPLESPDGGAVITWVDVTRYQHLRDELEEARRELGAAYDELQSAVEELETTNEELQSTNEELETTNEELHSTNEELETMNEELQSTNEELETINIALRERTSEVEELSRFQQSILASFRSAVIVLGGEMEVRAWNHQAEELWGLRSDEVVGQHFLNLDIGLPVDRLRGTMRDISAGRKKEGTIRLEAINRRGRPIVCEVYASPLVNGDTGRGVILTMDAGPVSASPDDQVHTPD